MNRALHEGERTPVDVTVVVACRNEAQHLEAFLRSLTSQDLGDLVCEVIIADGMSDDGTRERLEDDARQHAHVRVIDNPGRIVSTGLNAAIRASRGEIIVRMDVHTEYACDYVRECVEALKQTGADNVGGPARTRAAGHEQRAIAAAYHSSFSSGGARFHDERYEGEVDTVPYGCWRRRTLEDIGLFDESLVRNQDDELNLRIGRAGGRIWQSPRIRSWYRPRRSLTALFRQYFQYGFWKVAVIRKHRMPAAWRHLVPGVAVVLGLLLPLLAGVAALVDSASSIWFAGSWVLLGSAYVVCSIVASLCAARRYGWDLLVLFPVTFAVFHVSYGLGFLAGTVCFGFRPLDRATAPRLSTELTR